MLMKHCFISVLFQLLGSCIQVGKRQNRTNHLVASQVAVGQLAN